MKWTGGGETWQIPYPLDWIQNVKEEEELGTIPDVGPSSWEATSLMQDTEQ